MYMYMGEQNVKRRRKIEKRETWGNRRGLQVFDNAQGAVWLESHMRVLVTL